MISADNSLSGVEGLGNNQYRVKTTRSANVKLISQGKISGVILSGNGCWETYYEKVLQSVRMIEWFLFMLFSSSATCAESGEAKNANFL